MTDTEFITGKKQKVTISNRRSKKKNNNMKHTFSCYSRAHLSSTAINNLLAWDQSEAHLSFIAVYFCHCAFCLWWHYNWMYAVLKKKVPYSCKKRCSAPPVYWKLANPFLNYAKFKCFVLHLRFVTVTLLICKVPSERGRYFCHS